MNSNELLDKVKKDYNIASDYALAKRLGISQEGLRKIRDRGLSDERALQVATLLDLNPGEIMASVRAERAKSPEVKAAWRRIAESMRSALGVLAFVAICNIALFAQPAEAAWKLAQSANCQEYTLSALRRRVRRFLRSWRLWLSLTACFAPALAPVSVHADELRIGIGQNWTGGLHTGAWQQDGFPDNKNKNYGPAYALDFIGRTPIAWLDYQIGLAYRKGASAWDSVYITDPCYADGMYSGGPVVVYNGMSSAADCDRRFYLNRVETDTRAVTLALVPTYRGDGWSLGVALGVSIHHTEVRIDWDQSRGAFADVARDVDSTWTEHGTTYYVAPSLRVGQFFLTAYYAYGETAPESMGNGNRGVYTGLAFDL